MAIPGGVDVEVDVLVGVLGLEEEQLGDDDVRHVVVDLRPQHHDPVLEQAAVDVVHPLAPMGLLDDVGSRDVGHGEGLRDEAKVP